LVKFLKISKSENLVSAFRAWSYPHFHLKFYAIFLSLNLDPALTWYWYGGPE
jgi:hypothetical protein